MAQIITARSILLEILVTALPESLHGSPPWAEQIASGHDLCSQMDSSFPVTDEDLYELQKS